MKKTLEDKARHTIAQYHMIPPGSVVLAALSGGADSVALTHFLHHERAEKFTLLAAHVNHGLRGEESDRDEEFARNFCNQLGIEIHVQQVNIETARKKGESIESCGRRIRYEFFESVIRKLLIVNCKSLIVNYRISTAHTKNDNAETVLLNLARGSGGAGLCGIPAVRENIVRPFINVPREDILDYCARHGLSYVTDSSNQSCEYARNRIRTLVLPGLNTVNPAAVQTITRTAEFMAEDEAYLGALALSEAEKLRLFHPILGEAYPVAGLLALPSPLRRRILAAAALGVSGHVPESVHIKGMEHLLENGGQTSLPGDFLAAISTGKARGFLFFFKKECLPLQNREIIGMIEEICASDAKLTQNAPNVHKNFLIAALDSDMISGKYQIRTLQPGDTLQLPKRPKKLLRKLYSELGVPSYLRANAAVIADDEGVLAAEFAGVAQRAAVSKDTKRVLKICRNESTEFCSHQTK